MTFGMEEKTMENETEKRLSEKIRQVAERLAGGGCLAPVSEGRTLLALAQGVARLEERCDIRSHLAAELIELLRSARLQELLLRGRDEFRKG
jgi:hypothetical protein